MPRMMTDDSMIVGKVGTGVQAFQFSGVRFERLGATEYTLARNRRVRRTSCFGSFSSRVLSMEASRRFMASSHWARLIRTAIHD